MSPIIDKDEARRHGVAVIIPYYQRSAGLLGRALASVFAQDCSRPLQVLVVDDSSPVPARDEVAALPDDQKSRVTVLIQENSGPGAARNKGLDSLSDDIDYVAFLDSDDQWLEGHLARATAALDVGRDLFFSNFRDIGQKIGGFEERGHIDPQQHDPLPGVPDVRDYRGDLRDAVLAGCPVETSTVVFRRAPFRDLRFRAEFRHAYEDFMFWFEMAAKSSRVVFSVAMGTQYGEGINLYRGVVPGSDAYLRTVLGSTLFGASVRSAFPLTARQRASVKDRLDRNRRTFAAQLLHRLRRHQFPGHEIAHYLRADPKSWILLPWEGLCLTVAWILGRSADGQD